MSFKSIQPGEFFHLQRGQKVWLVDVRTPSEFASSHLAQAFNHPLSALGREKLTRPSECSGPLFLICQSGGRASQAAHRLQEAGQEDICLVEGGMNGWKAAGLPVVGSGQAVMSLERQVRIVAGLLVLLGVSLNRAGWDWGIHLSGLVGMGLVVAGLTDHCGMALLLAQMPWNRRR
jgi:rhodanese-related sulfurtransferase